MKLWESGKYYDKARIGSSDIRHPGMKILKSLSGEASDILDLGCGEGTRLNFIAEKKGTGVDISRKAIESARKNFPRLKFLQMNLEKLEFKAGSFDLIYSAYVLEHLDDIEKVLEEALRVLKKNGKLVLIAPNYGAPNRTSPLNIGGRLKKLIVGFYKDIARLFIKEKHLDWNKVRPLDSVKEYIQDYDVTLEPYLGSLTEYLKNKGFKVILKSSCWSEELLKAKPHQLFFRFLSSLWIYPFTMWGPHLLLVAQKK